MDVGKYNLEKDMKNSKEIISLLMDKAIALEFYSALCNVEWQQIDNIPDDEKIIDALMGVQSDIWSCSWRYAGGLIAQIRSDNYNVNENYMDFYCHGSEGSISDLVRTTLKQLGWEPIDDDNDFI